MTTPDKQWWLTKCGLSNQLMSGPPLTPPSSYSEGGSGIRAFANWNSRSNSHVICFSVTVLATPSTVNKPKLTLKSSDSVLSTAGNPETMIPLPSWGGRGERTESEDFKVNFGLFTVLGVARTV